MAKNSNQYLGHMARTWDKGKSEFLRRSSAGSSRKVLIFDDPGFWKDFAEQLIGEGYKVFVTGEILFANSELVESPPRLLIGDFYDENTVIRRKKLELLSYARKREIPVIVVHEIGAGAFKRSCIGDYSPEVIYTRQQLLESVEGLHRKIKEFAWS